MLWMNEYEVERAADRYGGHPVLGPATQTLGNLVEWTNSNSDGWPYWQKPSRAAVRLMELIERGDDEREGMLRVEYKKALGSIKSFRTRHNAAFEIIEPKEES